MSMLPIEVYRLLVGTDHLLTFQLLGEIPL